MKKCIKCNKEHDGTFGSGKYCSRSCANSRTFSEESKKKKSLANKGQIPPNKMERANFICKHCGTQFEDRINSSKKYCSRLCVSRAVGRLGGMKSKQGRRSKNEILFANMCEEHFDNVLTNENIFNGWDADVILSNEKIAVLWNGKWHYEKITENHSLKQVQNRDRIKIKEIKKAGYVPYIIKDMGGYNPDFVKEKFNIFLKEIAGS
jgi:hypothetical protein